MVATFYYAMPYDSTDAPLREAKVPCHDREEAWQVFRQDYPNAERVRLVTFEKR